MREELARRLPQLRPRRRRACHRAHGHAAGVLRRRRSRRGRGHLRRARGGVLSGRYRRARLDAVEAGDRRGQRPRDRVGSDAGAAVRHQVLRRRRPLRRGPGAARSRRRRLLALGAAAVGRNRQRRRNPLDRSDLRWPSGRRARPGQPGARRRRGASCRSGSGARHRHEHRADVGGGQQASAVGFVRSRPRRRRPPRNRDPPRGHGVTTTRRKACALSRREGRPEWSGNPVDPTSG